MDPDEFTKFYIHKLSTGNVATVYEAAAVAAGTAAADVLAAEVQSQQQSKIKAETTLSASCSAVCASELEEAVVAEVEVAAEITPTSESKKKRKKKGNKAEASSVEPLVGEDADILFGSMPAEGAAADGKQPSGNASGEAAAATSPLSPAAPAEPATTWSLILQTNLCKKDEAVLRAEAEKVYAAADVNGDGGLSKTEMKKVIQKDPGLRAKLVSGSWKDFFAALDKDGKAAAVYESECLSSVRQGMELWIQMSLPSSTFTSSWHKQM